ncbi:hypothetical protein PMAYCL1PPCAC_01723, partial [Pristionchus mayeri]
NSDRSSIRFKTIVQRSEKFMSDIHKKNTDFKEGRLTKETLEVDCRLILMPTIKRKYLTRDDFLQPMAIFD